jgi:hypothetical protein
MTGRRGPYPARTRRFAGSRRQFPLICALLFLLSVSCATVSRPPLEELVRAERYAGEDINGSFPEAVYIKTRTQTFNSYHYYLLRNGLIWYKSIDPSKKPHDWTLFERTGLPHNRWMPGFVRTKAVVEISADADELTALSEEGGFYRFCFDKNIAHNSNVWLDRYGWPEENMLYHDERTIKNRAWATGKRNSHVLYYEDPFGNQHHNGTMEIVTIYALLEDGQEICYGDTGLPGDFSRNFIGPEGGAFKAVALSASASTMFLINEAGEMYTRLADFDVTGCDPMFFKYTYIPYKSRLPGTDYFSNLTEWALPPEDWRAQPRIPLAGKAAITRHITILQNGQGNAARELRVAGLNEQGETGYWFKGIFADAWEFQKVPLYFSESALLPAAANPGARGERGPLPDKRLRGYWWNGDTREAGWEYEIPNFNILEGSCDLRVTWQGETCVLKLHPVELWTYLTRNYQPGRNGPPKMFFGTLEIPKNAFAGLSEDFSRRLLAKFGKNDKALFHYFITASTRYFFMRENSQADEALLLTDGTVTGYFPEFRRAWYIDNFYELPRFDSPELVFRDRAALSQEDYGELRRKIELNRAFRDELRGYINEMHKHKRTALQINFAYLPLDFVSRITFLNHLDVPKIHTITRFGRRIVLTNAAYTDIISNTRIRLYERMIILLEIRLDCYSTLAEELERGAEEAVFPPWFADNISDYWTAAGLPGRIAGTFFDASGASLPVVLNYRPSPSSERGLFGWFFTIEDPSTSAGDEAIFSIFIDPLFSARTIYSRQGKTPEDRTLRLKCGLYTDTGILNPDLQDKAEKTIFEKRLLSFMGNIREGAEVTLSFDGKTFEIQERPGFRVIFQGLVR